MNKHSKILSVFLSVLLVMGIGAIPATAKGDNKDNITIKQEFFSDKRNGAEENTTIAVSDEDMKDYVAPSSSVCFASESSESEWDVSNHFGYNYLGKLENGALMQSAYMDLYRFNESFLSNTSDFSTTSVSGSDFYIVGSVYNSSYRALSNNELFETYFIFKNDFPQFFWASSAVLAGSGRIYQLIYEDFANGEVRQSYNKAYREAAEGIIDEASKLYTNYEKALYVHNAICRSNTYAYEEDGVTAVNTGISHSLIGSLCFNESVCDGYSKAFQYIMNRLGVDCLLLTGKANGAHAWNMLQMDDSNYYFVDLTWDDVDSLSVDIYYQYFMPSGIEFLNTHTPTSPSGLSSDFISYLPETANDDSFSFYKKENLCVNNYSLKSYASAVRSSFELLTSDPGYTVGYIKFSNSVLSVQRNEMLQYLTSLVNMLECSDGATYNATFSSYQNVYFYKLTKTSSSENVISVYSDGELYGNYKTLTGAIESIDDNGSAYTIKLYSDAGIYPYTEFPETSSVCFSGHEYTSAASYPYSAISILSDITFNCNVAVDRVTLVGYSLFDEEGVRNVSYTKKFTISDNGIYLSNVDLQCLRTLTAGDINEDDVLNAQDLLIMQYHILGISVLPDNLLSAADVNSDGVIDSADLLIIQMLILYS